MSQISVVPAANMVTGASAILSALENGGVTHLFVNLGSDHPAFLTAFAANSHPNLRIFTCPNEMNALSAASGYAQITGRLAAVLVHVDCGTLGLAGAIHNVSKGRIPVMILAGTVPITQEGELRGTRNEHIHWIQDVPDQRTIVRQYMRYEHEIRTSRNAAQIVLRGLQFANSSPRGPVYLIASREALEEETACPARDPTTSGSQRAAKTTALEPIGLSPSAIEELGSAILNADKPLIVTSYCGKTAAGFYALKDLAELCIIAVHENAPVCNNFPTTSFLHQGHQWNGGGQLEALTEADLVIVVDSDVPWITTESKPSNSARIFHLDVDPLKEGTTLWYLPCEKRWKCDSSLALRQLTDFVQRSPSFGSVEFSKRLDQRRAALQERFQARQARLASIEIKPANGTLTVPFFMSRFRNATREQSVIGLNESITNLGTVADSLHHDKPLSLLGSGGGSLGWCLSGAVGVSLALKEEGRESLLVAFCGDGTWLFGVPASAYWMAMKYQTPFLTIIWHNAGWSSPRNACLRMNPGLGKSFGQGSEAEERLSERMKVTIDPSPAFGKIAEGAGNAWWAIADDPHKVDEILEQAIHAILKEKRSAVIEVVLAKI